MNSEITIGHLARETGCKISTIRYYEQIGLLPEPPRSSGNTRLYGDAHLLRLGFIQRCRELGLTQSTIRELLELIDQPDESCEPVTEIARIHLEDVNQRIAGLATLKSNLERMVSTCEGGRVDQCRIIANLLDHSRAYSLTDRKTR